ncbi:unnamed protein product [Sphagnum tenellum]
MGAMNVVRAVETTGMASLLPKSLTQSCQIEAFVPGVFVLSFAHLKTVCGGGSGDHNAQEFLEEVCLDCRVRSHHIFLDGCGCAQVERGDNCWLEGG